VGPAEPSYMLQSPTLVENCVGLYVPLLEFNHSEALRCDSSAMPEASSPISLNLPDSNSL
jgi:hypothetical protein